MQRHHFAFSVLLLAFGICVLPGCKPTKDETELATAFPAKNLQIICPWGAGGGTDRISRFFANSLKDELGYNCIVVNRTGGSGAGEGRPAYVRTSGDARRRRPWAP